MKTVSVSVGLIRKEAQVRNDLRHVCGSHGFGLHPDDCCEMCDVLDRLRDFGETTMSQATCELCGEPMPPGEEMFKFHGYSGPCPKPPLPKHSPDDKLVELEALAARATPGPWDNTSGDDPSVLFGPNSDGTGIAFDNPDDAAFIAAARNFFK